MRTVPYFCPGFLIGFLDRANICAVSDEKARRTAARILSFAFDRFSRLAKIGFGQVCSRSALAAFFSGQEAERGLEQDEERDKDECSGGRVRRGVDCLYAFRVLGI